MPTQRQIEVAEHAEKLLLAGARSYSEISRAIYGTSRNGNIEYIIACLSRCGIFKEAEAAMAHNKAQPRIKANAEKPSKTYTPKTDRRNTISSQVLKAIENERTTIARLRKKLPRLTERQIYDSLYKMGLIHVIINKHEMNY